MPTRPLAIVIPAYKSRFLALALRSIAAQTNQDFHVYLCDDASPENLRPVAEDILPAEQLTYRRFEPNAGARHLVRHWNRSVQCTVEPWVWLFSDDDLLEPTCVEAFLQTVDAPEGGAADVYRFNTLTINSAGAVRRINSPHPLRETVIDFAYHRLTQQRHSYAPEYLFRRSVWERSGGFVELPFAQGSDDASWITFGQERDLRLVEGPRVRWRLSDANISTASGSGFLERVRGCLEFAVWLRHRFAGQTPLPTDTPGVFDMASLTRDWVMAMLRTCPVMFSRRDFHEIPALVEREFGMPRREARRAMLRANGLAWGRGVARPWQRLLFPGYGGRGNPEPLPGVNQEG